MLRTLFYQLLVVLISVQPATAADNLRIASWNIADFHHQPGVEARQDIGTRRYKTDFEVLREYTDSLDADIIALQEIVTEKAARLLFPSSRYHVFMSSRYHEDRQRNILGDIYTAIAVKKRSDIKVIKQADLTDLQINPSFVNRSNTDFRATPTRRGTALLLKINGESFWVMSVHLKSSCAKVRRLDISKQKACQMLWKQRLALKKWIDERQMNRDHFVIAGDYNRRFAQLKNKGLLWSYLNNNDTKNPILSKFPKTGLRRCPTRKGKSNQPIDWIVMNRALARRVVSQSYKETRWTHADVKKHGNRLSDHCPVQIDIML